MDFKSPLSSLQQKSLFISNCITYGLIQENELYIEILQRCIFLEEIFCPLCEIHLINRC